MSKFSKIDEQRFKQAFDLFDKDGSGSISKEEIDTVFKELKISLSKEELEKIMIDFDTNKDNSIEFNEFLAVVSAHMEEPECEQWIFEVFQILDRDCDGFIGKEELMRASQCYNLGITDKQVELILEEGDPSGEGGICYEQFSKLLKTL